MAANNAASLPSLALQQQQQPSMTSQLPPQHSLGGIGVPSGALLSEEAKMRDLALHLHASLVQGQQLKMAGAQQQQGNMAASQQIAQAEEIAKQLKEVVTHLQEIVQDSSLTGLQERFKTMATKLDLKFEVQKQPELTSIFLMCDAYYVEICCQDNGHVASVKLAQASTQVDSPVLTRLARGGKFDTFQHHLQCLKDFYAHSTTTSDTANMYRVLSSLESILLSISPVPRAHLCDVIMNYLPGHVIPRSAGLPMKLVFFVHPYEVLKCPSLQQLNYPSDSEQQLWQTDGQDVGVSVKLLLETSSEVYPLTIDPNLFDAAKASFFPITPKNSVHIALNYVLHINKPFPVCGTIRNELHNVVYSAEQQNCQPLCGPHINQLIAQETARSKHVELSTSKSQIVFLPNQRHHYFMPPELRSHEQAYPPTECGMIMSKVSFLHPVHILSIVTLLRKQLTYNSLVASLLGKSPKDLPASAESADVELIFEVTTKPADKVTIVVDLQSDDSYLAVDFIISDQQPTSPLVKVKVGRDGVAADNQQLSAIVKRCMSIPVTLYAVVKRPQLLEEEGATLFQQYLQSINSFNATLGGGTVRTN